MPIWVGRYSGDCPLESMISIIHLEVNFTLCCVKALLWQSSAAVPGIMQQQQHFKGSAGIYCSWENQFCKRQWYNLPKCSSEDCSQQPSWSSVNDRVLEWKKKTLSTYIHSEVFRQIIEDGTKTQGLRVQTGKTRFLSSTNTLRLMRWGKMWEMWFLSFAALLYMIPEAFQKQTLHFRRVK